MRTRAVMVSSSARIERSARLSARMTARIKCLFFLQTHATHAFARLRMRANTPHARDMRANITRVHGHSCVRCVRPPIHAGFTRADMRADVRALRALAVIRARALGLSSSDPKK